MVTQIGKIGRLVAVVTRETNKGLGASEVISHDAPTSYIAAPTYEKRAAQRSKDSRFKGTQT
jgi:hypothetical protein